MNTSRKAVGRGLHRRERRGQRPLLLGYAAAANMRSVRIRDQLARERVAHAIGRMGHDVSHQDQASIRALGAELDQQIAHGVAPEGQGELLHERSDHFGNKALHLRFVLEALGLRARMANEGARPFDNGIGRNC